MLRQISERERDVYYLYLHLGVTSRTGGVEEGVGDRWVLKNPLTVTVLVVPKNFGNFGVLHPKWFVLYKAEKLLTHERLCHSKNPNFHHLFTETAQHPHPDAFIFQSNVPEISINKHNPLVIICCYPLKFQQRRCCRGRINPLVAILSAQMDTSPSSWLSQGGNCLTKASLGSTDSAPGYPSLGKAGEAQPGPSTICLHLDWQLPLTAG